MVSKLVAEWEARGTRITVDGLQVFVLDAPATAPERGDPLLVLHGFPTCSFDWRGVIEPVRAAGRRVVLFDFLGFGLSDKPDVRYSIRGYADTAEAVAQAVGLEQVVLVTHDLGDSVGGELLARVAGGIARLRGHEPDHHQRIDLPRARAAHGRSEHAARGGGRALRPRRARHRPIRRLQGRGRGDVRPSRRGGRGRAQRALWELAVVPGRASAAGPHDPLHRGSPARGAPLHRRDRGAPGAAPHHLGPARPGRPRTRWRPGSTRSAARRRW